MKSDPLIRLKIPDPFVNVGVDRVIWLGKVPRIEKGLAHVLGIVIPNCVGENISPALSWANPPEGTKSYAILMFEKDQDYIRANPRIGQPPMASASVVAGDR